MSQHVISKVFVVFVFFLGACAYGSVDQQSVSDPITHPPVLPEVLQAGEIGQTIRLTQIIENQSGEKKRSMQFRIEISPNSLAMVGISHLGVPLFSLSYEDGGELTINRHMPGDLPFDPQYMLSDFQITYWPAEVVAKYLKRQGINFEDGVQNGRRFRRVSKNGKTMMNIDYSSTVLWESSIALCHNDLSYCLYIRTLEQKGGA